MADKHPLDTHARAVHELFQTRGWRASDVAGAVLRVELSREPSDRELLAACAAYVGDEPDEAHMPVEPIRRALKAAMAARLKALKIDG